MIKLNVQARNSAEARIKEYLEQNASESLADKINNGVIVTKEDVQVVNKKDLTGCMQYASDEAKKQAEKGESWACVEDAVVFGWAVHYFEEDSIQGKLYNLDGSKYNEQKQVAKPTIPKQAVTKVSNNKKKQMSNQVSLFDLVESQLAQENQSIDNKVEIQESNQQELDNASNGQVVIDGEVIDFEDFDGDMDEQPIEQPKPKLSPAYEKYLTVQQEYKDRVVAMRLGDFYEIFGEYAKLVAKECDLTLTGRDLGLSERVPMVGFPYHAGEIYFAKILRKYDLVVLENDGEIIEHNCKSKTKQAEQAKHTNSEIDSVLSDLMSILGDMLEVKI